VGLEGKVDGSTLGAFCTANDNRGVLGASEYVPADCWKIGCALQVGKARTEQHKSPAD
jgi:hypothetical protein